MGMFKPMSLDVLPTLKNIPFLKDVPARAMKAAGKEARWFSLPAGGILFEADEPADSIFFVLSGTLGAFRKSGDGHNEFIGHIRTGEPVGEMGLFLGGIDVDEDGAPENAPHTGSVYAIRDSEVIAISRKGWQRMVKAEPELLEAMIRVILKRLGRAGQRSTQAAPKVFTLVGTSPTIDLGLRARALRDSLKVLGKTTAIVDQAMGDEKPSTFFDHLELTHDVVILVATIGNNSWYRLASRQADRIWVVGRADARPSNPLMADNDSPAHALKLVDVVLLHHGNERRAARPVEWLEASGASRVFHWTGVQGVSCDRLARVMCGRSVGVVMSGGGARAYSHIGMIRALREKGVPIDFAGGSSMGAVIAACVAMGWDDDEIDRRIRKAFVETNPLGDYTLPVVGMVKGLRVNARLKEHFGESEMCDLDIPFFATSTNLTSGTLRLHRTGLLREALRATISLPGILPPVVDGHDVLVDGAVLNNFPVDVMRDMHRGYVVGCDVTRQPEGLNVEEFINPPGFFRWVLGHGFSAAPPIAGLLMRTATIRSDRTFGWDMTDLLILPDLIDTQLRDWEAYDATVEAGYNAAIKALETSDILEKCCPA
ncbi:patatin-like phospholipase family protein [Hyphomonas johnsonii]|uniref:Cyclic nucleotide-binding/patatin-like phospholipase domain-containing protein n=1 Tax=Hyphomonas johnsonii MHS-2 TaxID=1280950 RepID=A0A059FE50_9PROT|nr:patatin-like phospholipase family protein [Hyphomonas johnsonii]KCZ88872.1 cyclic nucleotide-binding/patatin-like phospholipase domain-containing protein [Hyphomonas johnsonii MHS-2]